MNPWDELDTAVEDLCRYVETLPAAALADQAWGPREVLAHLVFYHELYLEQTHARLAGEPVRLLRGRYNDLNAQAVGESRGVPLPDLTTRLRAANRAWRALSAGCDPDALILPLKEGVTPYALSRLVPAVSGHIRNHLKLLRRAERARTAADH